MTNGKAGKKAGNSDEWTSLAHRATVFQVFMDEEEMGESAMEESFLAVRTLLDSLMV